MIPTRMNQAYTDGYVTGFDPETFALLFYSKAGNTRDFLEDDISTQHWRLPFQKEFRYIAPNLRTLLETQNSSRTAIYVKDQRVQGKSLNPLIVEPIPLHFYSIELVAVKQISILRLLQEWKNYDTN